MENTLDIKKTKHIDADTISQKLFQIALELKSPKDVVDFYKNLDEHLDAKLNQLKRINEMKETELFLIGTEENNNLEDFIGRLVEKGYQFNLGSNEVKLTFQEYDVKTIVETTIKEALISSIKSIIKLQV